jgi:hypothetical protein
MFFADLVNDLNEILLLFLLPHESVQMFMQPLFAYVHGFIKLI